MRYQPDYVATSPASLVRRAYQIATSIFTSAMSSEELTPLQHAVLARVAEYPGIDQTSLGFSIALDRTTTTHIIDVLERRALISRTTDPTNRRAKRLHASREGLQLLELVEPMLVEARAKFIEPLDEGEQRRFIELITKLVEANNRLSRAPYDPERLRSLSRAPAASPIETRTAALRPGSRSDATKKRRRNS